MTASARVLGAISEIPAATWDGLANPASRPFNPFVAHAFLKALEESRSATARAGWQPAHIVLEEAGHVAGLNATNSTDTIRILSVRQENG